MLRVTVSVPQPVPRVWFAIADFFNFGRYFTAGQPSVSRLTASLGAVASCSVSSSSIFSGDNHGMANGQYSALRNREPLPRRRIEYPTPKGLGFWLVQELQVLDHEARVALFNTVDSKLPGGTSRMELVRVSADEQGSRVEVLMDYRSKWHLLPFTWLWRRRIRHAIVKALTNMALPVEAMSQLDSLAQPLKVLGISAHSGNTPAWVSRVLGEGRVIKS